MRGKLAGVLFGGEWDGRELPAEAHGVAIETWHRGPGSFRYELVHVFPDLSAVYAWADEATGAPGWERSRS